MTIPLVGVGLLAGCSASAEPPGVASLNGGGAASDPNTTAKDSEAALLSFVECLRGKGLDVPDPEVDADGNLSLNPRAVFGQGGGDREKLQTAIQDCGGMPEGVTGGFSQEDRTQFQDTLLKFAECMRGEGVDMPDPDLSGFQPGGGGAGQGGGPFGQLNRDDPKVAAALEACQQVFTDSGLGQPGGSS